MTCSTWDRTNHLQVLHVEKSVIQQNSKLICGYLNEGRRDWIQHLLNPKKVSRSTDWSPKSIKNNKWILHDLADNGRDPLLWRGIVISQFGASEYTGWRKKGNIIHPTEIRTGILQQLLRAQPIPRQQPQSPRPCLRPDYNYQIPAPITELTNRIKWVFIEPGPRLSLISTITKQKQDGDQMWPQQTGDTASATLFCSKWRWELTELRNLWFQKRAPACETAFCDHNLGAGALHSPLIGQQTVWVERQSARPSATLSKHILLSCYHLRTSTSLQAVDKSTINCITFGLTNVNLTSY